MQPWDGGGRDDRSETIVSAVISRGDRSVDVDVIVIRLAWADLTDSAAWIMHGWPFSSVSTSWCNTPRCCFFDAFTRQAKRITCFVGALLC